MKLLHERHLLRLTIGLWAVLLAVTCVRPLFKPTSSTVYTIYARAGENFRAGTSMYGVYTLEVDVFRYFPIVAAFFGPWGELPLGVGGALWRVLGAVLFLTGLGAWSRRMAPDAPVWLLYLGALPLSVGSIANGQANTHIAGLMLWGTVLAGGGRWAIAGGFVAAAALFKMYPIALGGLLVLLAPIRFGVPLAIALGLGAVLPYAVQSSEYVTNSYRELFHSVSEDDRTERPLYAGLQDFQMLLRIAGLPISREQYMLMGGVMGLAAAGLVAFLRYRGRSHAELAYQSYSLGACWMLVFGPCVEASTFIILAPVMACEIAMARTRRQRLLSFTGAAIFLLSVVLFAFPHSIHRPIVSLGILPVAAVLLTMGTLVRLASSRIEAPALYTPSDTALRRAA